VIDSLWLKIKVKPIASENLGVRSMALYAETPDVRILFDLGVSLGLRFRLLPHPIEYRRLYESREELRVYVEKAEVVTASHYHFDHITPTSPTLRGLEAV